MGIKRSRLDSVSSSEEEDTNRPYSREQSVDIKIVHLDSDLALSDCPAVMRCSLPPHQPLAFDSFEAYDVHYQKTHMNRCSECQRNFPDDHFLNLHIAENHDPINDAKREKGEKTYACLVPDCDRFCSTPQKRRLHCIDKHQFPRNYDFFIVDDGIDRRSSMLRSPHRRRSSALSSTQGSVSSPNRLRGESIVSVGEGMEVVRDGEDEEDEGGQGNRVGGTAPPSPAQREPLKLRGRGGFGHPRGAGRGSRGTVSAGTALKASSAPTAAPATDSVDRLTASMSALKFIPHSVQMARGRGKVGGVGSG